MRAKNAKAIRKAFKVEKQMDVLGPADRRVGSSVEKNAYVTAPNGTQNLVKVRRDTMVNVTKSAYRRMKKDLLPQNKK